jgi:glutamate synthase (NADPH/NADH) small chain
VGTAIRQGAKEVIQLEILPKPPVERTPDMPWPEHPRLYRKSASHEEGGVQHWSVMTNEFLGKKGSVSGLSCSEVEFKNRTFIPKQGTEFTIDAQLVILATGFISPEQDQIIKPLGIETDERSQVAIDDTGATSEPWVFSAGDAVTGPSLLVKAIASGRAAAQGVHVFLTD